MKTDLIGGWSTYPLQGGAPNEAKDDQFLVFRRDGTGWYDWSTLVVSNVKLFEWRIEEPNHIHFSIGKHLRRYDGPLWEAVEYEPENFVMPFEITEQETPFSGLLPFLRITLGFEVEGYCLVNETPNELQVPAVARS